MALGPFGAGSTPEFMLRGPYARTILWVIMVRHWTGAYLRPAARTHSHGAPGRQWQAEVS